MRWIKIDDRLPPVGEEVYVKYMAGTDRMIMNVGSYNEEVNEIQCNYYCINKSAFKYTEWLDESEDAHTPENPFRAEVAKSVLAALVSRGWSHMDLACEQAVKAADKLIQKLKQ